MNIAEVVEIAKKNTPTGTYQAVADHCGVRWPTVNGWKKGNHVPGVEHAHALAELAGLDPAPVIAICLEASTKNEKVKATLRRFTKAVAAAAIIATVQIPASAPTQAAAPTFNAGYTLYALRRFMRLWTATGRLAYI